MVHKTNTTIVEGIATAANTEKMDKLRAAENVFEMNAALACFSE